MSLVYNPEEPLNKARKPKDIRFKSDDFTISIKDREIRNEMIKFPINAKISPYLHQDQVIQAYNQNLEPGLSVGKRLLWELLFGDYYHLLGSNRQ